MPYCFRGAAIRIFLLFFLFLLLFFILLFFLLLLFVFFIFILLVFLLLRLLFITVLLRSANALVQPRKSWLERRATERLDVFQTSCRPPRCGSGNGHLLWRHTWTDNLENYCWWTKSCTTKDDNYPIVYTVLTIPGGAGFLPSTVPRSSFTQDSATNIFFFTACGITEEKGRNRQGTCQGMSSRTPAKWSKWQALEPSQHRKSQQ